MLLEQAATEFVEFTTLETPGIELDVEGIALEVDACSSIVDLKKWVLKVSVERYENSSYHNRRENITESNANIDTL